MFAAVDCSEPARRPSPEEVAAALQQLPSSPTVLPRLSAILHAPDVSLQQVGSLLRLDPGLTARVLAAGNQLAGIRGGLCLTVEDAINQIGFNAIAALVGDVAKAQVLAQPVGLYGVDAEDFWQSAATCALAAELLAEVTGEDPCLAYTVGLFHNVGMVAIDAWSARHAASLSFMSRGRLAEFVESERALLGFTQAEVAAALLRQWGLPVMMIEPVRWQYAPHGSAGYARLACLLNAAKWLRSAVCAEEESRPPFLPDQVVLDPLRLTPERLGRLVVDVRIRFGGVRNLLEVAAA